MTEHGFAEVVRQWRDELIAVGFSVREIEKIRFFDKVRTLGNCRKVSDTSCILSFSRSLVAIYDDDEGYETCKETILHELIHAMPNSGRGHGYAFKALAARVNLRYAVQIGACHSKETISPWRAELLKNGSYKYFLACEKGCFKKYYARRCKSITHPEDYHCSHCGGKLLAGAI